MSKLCTQYFEDHHQTRIHFVNKRPLPELYPSKPYLLYNLICRCDPHRLLTLTHVNIFLNICCMRAVYVCVKRYIYPKLIGYNRPSPLTRVWWCSLSLTSNSWCIFAAIWLLRSVTNIRELKKKQQHRGFAYTLLHFASAFHQCAYLAL